MRIGHFVVVCAGLLASANALADGLALAKKSGCMACHAVDRKLVCPAYKDVAAKYKGDKEAAARLVLKARNGGSGSFGSLRMPAAPASVSDEDIKTIVAWILSLN